MASPQPLITVSLEALPPGSFARLVEIRGGRQLVRRLLALGLRLGSELQVLHRRGSGLVILHGDTRIALGGGIADKLRVLRLNAPAAPDEP